MAGTVTIHDLAPETAFDADGADVVAGMAASPRFIPPRYGYDETGSKLYELMTELPTYYLTRAERALLERHGAEIAAATHGSDVVELGSGSAKKTRLLLGALQEVGREDLRYVPIDISREMLVESSEALAAEFPGLPTQAVAGSYESGLAWVRANLDAPRTVVFLGSSLGNFTHDGMLALLEAVAESCAPGDELLLGVDLIKSPELLERCYNDPPGHDVFARFRRNRLENLNRLFGADFDPAVYDSRATWAPERASVEAHLRPRAEQRVRLPALDLDLTFAAGEPILVDISMKYDRAELGELLGGLGFDEATGWVEPEHEYALLLYRRR